MTGAAGGRVPWGSSSHLRPADLWSIAVTGFSARPVRAFLSATGIALGVATMVAVLGISSSSRAQLVAEIDALGTNLLTVAPDALPGQQTASLRSTAPAMAARIGPVLATSAIGDVNANVYRNDRIPSANTNAISVYAASVGLLTTLQGRLDRGRFLNRATAHFPAVVLGADAATALGVDRADGSVDVWLGRQWFAVVGVLDRLPLAPELDRAALVGFPVARQLLHASGLPAELYVRTDPTNVNAVASVLAATVEPAAPQNVAVANPTDALIARADASATFESLFLALGAVALLVGGVGIANVMVIAVLERRGEIGLRRALGATRAHVAAQFVAESVLLALVGGTIGAVLGVFATTVYATVRHWDAVASGPGLAAAVAAALAVGGVAGTFPALRAARLSPTEALRAV